MMKRLLLILALGVLYSQSHSLNFDGENDYLSVNTLKIINSRGINRFNMDLSTFI